MASVQFQLFRIQVFFDPQMRLPIRGPLRERDRTAIIEQAIRSKPSIRTTTGMVWHLGNVEEVQNRVLHFAVGRTTRTTMDYFDEGKGDFIEVEFATAPYTHAIVDLELEVCAIAAKNRLSRTINGIARRLDDLLNRSDVAVDNNAHFEVTEIANPDDFLRRLRRAEAVTSFTVAFRLPNAFDADKDFLEPRMRLAEAARAKRGKIEIAGTNLNKDVVESVARSVAATGDDAHAKIRERKGSDELRIDLRHSNVLFRAEEPDSPDTIAAIIAQVRSLYARVREGQPKQKT